MPRGRILAIDDERFFRNLYSDILSQEGYHVVTAESGEEGLQIFSRESFDIVITDMAMKGMDGLQTMEAIKKMNPGQDVVIVTGIGDVQMAVNAMKKGVTDYMLKPINPDDFLHIIRNILEKQNLVAEHSKLISENIEYFGILSVYQRCLRILSVLEMDRLLDLILDAIMSETNAQGSILWLISPENRDELRLATARGVVNLSSEAGSIKLSTHRDPDQIKAGKPFYERSGDGVTNENIFYAPLKLDEKLLGLIKVSDKLDRDRFEIRDMMIAKTIAGFASIAVGNAKKVRDMEFRGFRDQKTGTYHINYFTDYVTKEINKARRYHRTFSVLYLKIGNYSELRGRFKDHLLHEAIQGVIDAVTGIIRDADILAMARNDEYFILLPETDYFGSLMSIRRINKAIKGKTYISSLKESAQIDVALRSVSFPKDGGDLKNLLDVVRRRVGEAKKSLYTRHRLGDMDFWAIFDALVGKGEDYPLALIEGKAPVKGERRDFEDDDGLGRCILFTPQILSQVHEVIFGEIERSAENRGILYLGGRDMERFLNLLRRHPKVENSATKVFILGEKGEKEWDLPNATPLFVSGEEIEKVQFLIFLSVDYAYCVLCREREDGVYYGIHVSDPIFVENIIAKLQENYHLQVQL
jgi:diguanylate cyclase (GGDEF)-like protein